MEPQQRVTGQVLCTIGRGRLSIDGIFALLSTLANAPDIRDAPQLDPTNLPALYETAVRSLLSVIDSYVAPLAPSIYI